MENENKVIDIILKKVQVNVGNLTISFDDAEIKPYIKEIRSAKVRNILNKKGVVIQINNSEKKITFITVPIEDSKNTEKEDVEKKEYKKEFSNHEYIVPPFHEDMKRAIQDASGMLVYGVGNTGTGKCVTGDTLILTDAGIKKIENVSNFRNEDSFENKIIGIYGQNGIERTSHFYDGGNKPVWKVTTRQGLEIKGTANHRIIASGLSGQEWKHLPNLKKGDRVLVKNNTQLYGNKPHDLNFLTGSDFEIGWFLGVYTGDGSLAYRTRKSGNKVYYYVGITTGENPDKRYMHNLKNIIEKVTGIEPKINGPYKRKDGKASCINVKFCNRQIAEWLKKNIGNSAETKVVPKVILEGSKEIQRGYLSGYFDTDGWNSKGEEIGCASNSKELIKTIQIILLNMGIVSKTYQKTEKSSSLTITGKGINQFLNEIGFITGYKNIIKKTKNWSSIWTVPFVGENADSLDKNLRYNYTSKKIPARDCIIYKKRGKIGRDFLQRNDVYIHVSKELSEMAMNENFWDEIVSVEFVGNQQVFDLTVPGTHSFVANGFMNHNTHHLRVIAEELNMKLYLINCKKDMDTASFLGDRTIAIDEKSGQNHIVWKDGPVVKAMQEGLDETGNEIGEPALLVIDEAPVMPSHIAIGFNNLLENWSTKRRVVLDGDGGRVITSHSGFRIVMLGNTIGKGITDLSDASYTAQGDALDISTLDRIHVIFRYGYNRVAEEIILKEKIGNNSDVDKILKVRNMVREELKAGKITTPFSTRIIVQLADAYRVFDGNLGKAFYYTVLNKVLPEEIGFYNETIVAITGEDCINNYGLSNNFD